MTLASLAYEENLRVGELVSRELRDLLFEQGVDVGRTDVLVGLADERGITVDLDDPSPVLRDHADGVARGVVGSPHFFTAQGGFFCPALDVSRDDSGHLRLIADAEGFDRFIADCFG
jgi:2-hydroxychromene-2-carboxylate isomerase